MATAVALLSADSTATQAKRYWCRKLADAAFDLEDLLALVRLLNDDGLDAARTAAQRARGRIDFARGRA